MSKRSARIAPIPNVASARAWASAVLKSTLARSASKLRHCALSRSARAITARSSRSSKRGSMANRCGPGTATTSTSITATSGVRTITTEGEDMLTHPTLDQLNHLSLYGMAKAFGAMTRNDDARTLSDTDRPGLISEHEQTWRQEKRSAALLSQE